MRPPNAAPWPAICRLSQASATFTLAAIKWELGIRAPAPPAVSTEDSRLMDTWWTLVLWVLVMLAGGGVLSLVVGYRLRTSARRAVDRWRHRRRTYGVGPIRTADRVRSGQWWPPRTR